MRHVEVVRFFCSLYIMSATIQLGISTQEKVKWKTKSSGRKSRVQSFYESNVELFENENEYNMKMVRTASQLSKIVWNDRTLCQLIDHNDINVFTSNKNELLICYGLLYFLISVFSYCFRFSCFRFLFSFHFWAFVPHTHFSI